MANMVLMTVYDDVANGIRMLGSYLRSNGHTCELLFLKKMRNMTVSEAGINNKNITALTFDRIQQGGFDVSPWTKKEQELTIDFLFSRKPDIIGFSSRSFLDDENIKLLRKIRKALPESVIVAGGFGPTLNAEAYAAVCDYVIIGEGEDALLDMAQAHDSGQSMDGIDNLAFMADGKLVSNPVRPAECDIDRFPPPLAMAHGMFHIESETFFSHDPGGTTCSILAGRGCTGKCSYCGTGQWTSYYKEWGHSLPPRRNRNVDNVIRELHNAKNANARSVFFGDPFLVGSRSYLLDLFHRYEEEIGLPFYACLHPAQVLSHPEILEAAARAGMACCCVGIQHADEEFARDVYTRNVSNDDVVAFAQMIRDNDIACEYHFIDGNPLQKEDHLDRLIELIRRLPFDAGRDMYAFMKLMLLPGTPLAERIGKNEESLFDPIEWAYNTRLANIATVADDTVVDTLRAAPLYRQNPHLLAPLFRELWFQKVQRDRTPVVMSGFETVMYERAVQEMVGREVIIWGAGGVYEAIAGTFANVRVRAFVDNDPSKWGSSFHNAPVIAPNQLNRMEPLPVFICSQHKLDVMRQLRADHPRHPIIP